MGSHTNRCSHHSGLATWEALPVPRPWQCLGSAGATEVFRDFTGVPQAGAWFGKAESGAIFGSDLDPPTADIRADSISISGKQAVSRGYLSTLAWTTTTAEMWIW